MAATLERDTVEYTDVAARVREASRPAHQAAETRGFVTRLMGGELSLDAYIGYLAQFAWIYEALEGRTRLATDPAIFDPALDRFAAIESDLRALGVTDWRTEYPMLPATAAYVARLEAVRDASVPYLAHHYTRYLGDLSGGQAIAALVARHYGATPEQLSFYNFSDLGSPVRYKESYREQMNTFGLDEAGIDELIAEVAISFELNSALFDELGQQQDTSAR